MTAKGRAAGSQRLRSQVASALFGALATLLLLHGSGSGSGSSLRGGGGTPSQRSGAAGCRNKSLQPPRTRLEMGDLLEREGFTSGAELGVQRGEFALTTLAAWPSCQQYILVDVWRQQENYEEAANVDDGKQQANYDAAVAALKPFEGVTEFLRMFTSESAPLVPDSSLDYVDIDARHDYCGCAEDMALWWPKLRPGGILAGHDYLNAKEIKEFHPNEDWCLCANGTRHEGAVKGAVGEFAAAQGLTVAVTYREIELGNPYGSWLLRKPEC
ncbi:hypothetical protein C2E20_0340 [Micractinium conductrix]|uniref:O-methyltransferase n=1 Tax=Micractinium conductrix TaxID=554055 RepID=A0A2P6VSC1_9CHLO|nr:hypothetical protein C2E20_0340 [Micractinium conductrix]|eukprot:PSC76989.1 hypothetical protein C2E20_0340 [Micractinium conductrix]